MNSIFSSRKKYHEVLEGYVKELSSLQQILYASNRQALLLIFQGRGAFRPDGGAGNTFPALRPALRPRASDPCSLKQSGQAGACETEPDLLWRTSYQLPCHGEIGIFNRSRFEEVVACRAHPATPGGEETFWEARYRSIKETERDLHCNATMIVKIFLHLSYEEQHKQLTAGADAPHKPDTADRNLSLAEERQHWAHSMEAYQECLRATSTDYAPWYVVPADNKLNARLIVSAIVLDVLKEVKKTCPQPTAMRRDELQSARMLLAN